MYGFNISNYIRKKYIKIFKFKYKVLKDGKLKIKFQEKIINIIKLITIIL